LQGAIVAYLTSVFQDPYRDNESSYENCQLSSIDRRDDESSYDNC
jgi:hypothetical protein